MRVNILNQSLRGGDQSNKEGGRKGMQKKLDVRSVLLGDMYFYKAPSKLKQNKTKQSKSRT